MQVLADSENIRVEKGAMARSTLLVLLVLSASMLLAGCGGENAPVAAAKKALRSSPAPKHAETSDSAVTADDAYVERYQAPADRLARRQQRIREAAAGATVTKP